MAIIDVVRFDGLKTRDWLIFKYPSEKLVMGTQLIVQEGQVALFASKGKLADVFEPGTYTLSTNNIPILKSLVNLPFGGDTPFSAEIYFINTTVRLDIYWGLSDPIQLVDPKYYVKLRIRAFGQMGLKIGDPSKIFKELIGGMQKDDIVKFDKIKDYFKGILVVKTKTAIANAIITNGISALEISAKTETISENVKNEIGPQIEQFGFYLVNFFIESINFPEEDFESVNKILQSKAEFEIMGDSRYTTKRSFDVYEGAATNENGVAGAFAAGGIGVGAAINIGNSMMHGVGNPMQRAQTRTCASCGAQIPINTKFCPECGYSETKKECAGCHALIPASSKYCPECGFDNSEIICECGNKLAPGTKFCPECGKKV